AHNPVAQAIGAAAPNEPDYFPPIATGAGVVEVQPGLPELGLTTIEEFCARAGNCQICKAVIGNDLSLFDAFGEMHGASATASRDSQTPAAAKMCRFHFLLNRFKEPKAVAKLSAEDRAAHVQGKAAGWRDCYSLRPHLREPGTKGYIELWS